MEVLKTSEKNFHTHENPVDFRFKKGIIYLILYLYGFSPENFLKPQTSHLYV